MEIIPDIIGKIFVIKRIAGKYVLPTVEQKEVEILNSPISDPYLQVRVLNYNANEGELEVKPESGNPNENHFLISQQVMPGILSRLFIEKVYIRKDTTNLNYKNFNDDVAYRFEEDSQTSINRHQLSQFVPPVPVVQNTLPINFKKEEEISLSISELSIEDGNAKFKWFIKDVQKTTSFSILNSFLSKPLDSVKNYLPNALNIKKFKIKISYSVENSKIYNNEAFSDDVSRVDQTIFDIIENRIVNEQIVDTDDEVYDLVERIDSLPEPIKEKLSNENQVMDYLLIPEKTKHYHHLLYLSGKYSHNFCNLKLTGKPLSFLFIITHASKVFLVWKTYKTEEATYVWKIKMGTDTERKIEISEITELIKKLRRGKKEEYLKTQPDEFIRIQHNYSSEDLGFKQWKHQLESFIEHT